MGHLAIFALGPLQIELNGQPIQTSRHKALALLVYLAMQPEKQTRGMLATFLWPEYGQEKAYAYLRRTIWELNSLLGEGWMDADREKIGLNSSVDIFLDIANFQAHLADFNRHNHPGVFICQQCIQNLHKAALLYRGDFLSGFSLRDSVNFDDWLFFQQEALRRKYAEALQKLANLLLQERSYSEAISFGQRWLALDTLNEAAHRQIMKAAALSGQRHLALRQYQECQRILQTDLGISPDSETTALFEKILTGKYPQEDEVQRISPSETASIADWLAETPLSPTIRQQNNLPVPATKFIGRQKELNRISALLADLDCWLLTLLGPGGIGKTRLAIEFGQKQIGAFPQGVFFVPLSAVADEQSIAPTIARGLGLILRQNGPAPEEQIFDFLREKTLLLILDSFEGLLPWSTFLAQLHTQAPGIKLLVTSRHRLLLQGEWVLNVRGLEYPPEPGNAYAAEDASTLAFAAVELFVQAAHRTRVDFEASPEELAAIHRITRLLEGMPLGLELAATWVKTLSCQEIEGEIRRGLDVLETPMGDMPERQRSLRAVFDYSWDLLTSREQVLLPRLSVLRSNFSWQAAEQVAGIALRELSGLMDKSLVRRTPQGRFDLHDLLRQYCSEKLERMPADNLETNHRHCAYFSACLVAWNLQLNSAKQGQALREIETELANIQTAWDWAVQQQCWEYLAQSVDGLCMFYLRRARFAEGLIICQKAIDALEGLPISEDFVDVVRLSARLFSWQGVLNLNLEKLAEAEACLYQCQKALADPRLESQPAISEWIFALVVRGLIANLSGDPDAMLIDYEQAIQRSRQVYGKIPRVLIYIWRFLMGGAISKELFLQMEKSLLEVRQSNDPFELACHLYVLGVVELFHFYRMEKAEALLQESIQNFQMVDDPAPQVMIIKTLGYLLLVKGDFEEALALKHHELEINQDIGDRRMIGITQAEVGEILYYLGRYNEAEDQIRSGIALLQDRSDYEVALRHRYLGDVLLAGGKYTEAREAYHLSYQFFQSRNEKGWMFTALTGLSRAELALENRPSAWEFAHQALRCSREVQLYTFFAYLSIAEVALLLADQGEIIKALELYGFVLQQGHLAKSRWFADVYGKFIEEAAVQVSLEEQAAAKKRGQEFDFWRTMMLLDRIQAN